MAVTWTLPSELGQIKSAGALPIKGDFLSPFDQGLLRITLLSLNLLDPSLIQVQELAIEVVLVAVSSAALSSAA